MAPLIAGPTLPPGPLIPLTLNLTTTGPFTSGLFGTDPFGTGQFVNGLLGLAQSAPNSLLFAQFGISPGLSIG